MVVMRSMTVGSCYRPRAGLSIVRCTSQWCVAPDVMMALHCTVLLYYMEARYKR
jgi:hypothetical protein